MVVIPVIPALGRLRQQDHELGAIVSLLFPTAFRIGMTNSLTQ
jgi:hypothetical protein